MATGSVAVSASGRSQRKVSAERAWARGDDHMPTPRVKRTSWSNRHSLAADRIDGDALRIEVAIPAALASLAKAINWWRPAESHELRCSSCTVSLVASSRLIFARAARSWRWFDVSTSPYMHTRTVSPEDVTTTTSGVAGLSGIGDGHILFRRTRGTRPHDQSENIPNRRSGLQTPDLLTIRPLVPKSAHDFIWPEPDHLSVRFFPGPLPTRSLRDVTLVASAAAPGPQSETRHPAGDACW